jgi:hypothetical protein
MNELTPEERLAMTRGMAEQQVDYFIDSVLKRYGIQPSEVPEIVDELRWLQAHRRMTGRIINGTVLTVIATLVGVGLLLLWEGFKHFVGLVEVKKP